MLLVYSEINKRVLYLLEGDVIEIDGEGSTPTVNKRALNKSKTKGQRKMVKRSRTSLRTMTTRSARR